MKRASLPDERISDQARARRLEWWTIGWMASVVIVMGLVMGTSQAMKTAWIEDLLSFVPPVVFLIASHFEDKPPTENFPFGFQRVNSLAFLIAAVALTGLGAILLFNSLQTLVKGERVTIGLVTILGYQLWAGWLMVAALLYSIIPPVILGRMKLPLARRLQDKVLHTDAEMNKADWQTGLAAIAGVIGLGLGLWWADALAAGVISFSILKDGLTAMRSATAELVDGAPRALAKSELADDAIELRQAMENRFPGANIKMRETGRYIRVVVEGARPPDDRNARFWPPHVERAWRLQEVTFEWTEDEPSAASRPIDRSGQG